MEGEGGDREGQRSLNGQYVVSTGGGSGRRMWLMGEKRTRVLLLA